MKIAFFCILCITLSLNTFSKYAEVVLLKGKKVTYNSLSLKKGQIVSVGGVLKTGIRSFVKLELKEAGGFVSVGPKSEVVVKANEERAAKVMTLIRGALRYKGPDKHKDKKPVFYSKNASMGVRGTDLLIKANPILGETEIVLFSGLVQMTNLANETNSEEIAPGQWGGIGGRFGPNVQKPIQLPAKALNGFERLLNW